MSLGKLLPRDPEADHGGVDDMTKLTYLNEPGVLYNLARRYALNEIYVSISLSVFVLSQENRNFWICFTCDL